MKLTAIALLSSLAALADGVPPSEQPKPEQPKRRAAKQPARPRTLQAPEMVEAPGFRQSSESQLRKAPAAPAAECSALPEAKTEAWDPKAVERAPCLPAGWPDRSCIDRRALCARDREVARIAWQYFRKNTQPTGLVNAVEGYPSTTMWDAASSLAATLAARELDIIGQKEMDDRVSAMLGSFAIQKLYKDELPNKVYDSDKNEMADYGNKPAPNGIGYSALDIARLASWLDIAACLHPNHRFQIERVLARYDFCRLVKSGEMYGASNDGGQDQSLQEGRTGYEQYGGKALQRLGFSVPKSSKYRNASSREVLVEGVALLADKRGPKQFGAYNYVATESYALDAMEHGVDAELRPLLNGVLEAQRRRWQRTGIPTAASEDHIDRAPWFLYGTLWTDEIPWATITDAGQDYSALRWVSVKASFSLATLFPDDPYSAVLMGTVRSAYDKDKGWYAGVFENGLGYNRALTANTNGIILEALLYKSIGPLSAICARCRGGARLTASPDKCVPAAAAR